MNIPEKWCIKRTKDTWKVINDYFNSLGGTYAMNNPNFPYIPMWEGKTDSCHECKKGYTEITFEQFEKYILNPFKIIEIW